VKNIAIFASGTGSNAQKIIKHFNHANHPLAKVTLIVSNKETAGVVSIAHREKIPVVIIDKATLTETDEAVQALRKRNIHLVVLAGFLLKIPESLIGAYPNRIINIHPALLPSYGGKGMYGANVHKAVIDAGEQESGITIHYVDGHYDNGDVIFQAKCKILPGDTPESLATRIHQLEHTHFPLQIEKIISGL